MYITETLGYIVVGDHTIRGVSAIVRVGVLVGVPFTYFRLWSNMVHGWAIGAGYLFISFGAVFVADSDFWYHW